MSFRVPDSTPPSTPSRTHYSTFDDHPSTTPAGPPPTSLTGLSTTPAGNPPTSSFLNGSAVPFPAFHSSSRNPSANSFSRSRKTQFSEDDGQDEDIAAMDEDETQQQQADQLMTYSQGSGDSFIGSGGGLNLRELAKGVAVPMSTSLKEPDQAILQTEQILDSLTHQLSQTSSDEANALSFATQSLLDTWRQAYPLNLPFTHGRMGPEPSSGSAAKAVYIATLLFRIHHPPLKGRNHRGLSGQRHHSNTIPGTLLEWLHIYHWPFKSDFDEVCDFKPNPACHERFWDIIYNTTLRGDIKSACELLAKADFAQAATARDDGYRDNGYQGKQLTNANRVIKRAIEVLESCPAAQNGDWNVKGAEWLLYRKKVQQARSDLQSFAEGASMDRYSDSDPNFEASHFGMSNSAGNGLTVSQRSRQAESKVPWSIYQNLVYLYGQLLGTPSEIIAASNDWLEATLAITAWWDGEDAETKRNDLESSRRFSKTLQRRDRLVDTHTQAAYLSKLSEALSVVQNADEDDFELQIDPTDPNEVALSCVVTSEFDGLLRILKGWSPMVAAAIVEIGAREGWLGRARPSKEMIDGFNQSDLMVLSYAQQRGLQSDHDTVLCEYAGLLFKHGTLQDHEIKREGWQVAVEVLGRLHDDSIAETKIGELLDELDLKDSTEVDETIRLCSRIGLQSQARRISERYGDKLAETTHLYGTAIFYYTRAGAGEKIKNILDLLTSLSLVQSFAYPPADEMDESLQFLIQTPKQTISKLAVPDPEMLMSLLRHISGYATVRKFYELRDQDFLSRPASTPSLRPVARKKEALSNLVSVIQSACDCIHGGLFDYTVDTAIPCDCLLIALGEMLPFVNHPRSLLSHTQTVALLKAIEDLSTVSSTIFDRCDERFRSAIASAHGSAPPSPRATLKNSMSGLSVSRFSLVGSDLLKQSGTKSNGSSGVLVTQQVKRGWDWRHGLAEDAEGQDVLKILRLGLSKEMSRTWLREDL